MAITTLLGIIIGVGALLGAMVLMDVSFAVLGNGPAITLILAGTVAAVMNAFPISELSKTPRLFGVLFRDDNDSDKVETTKLFIKYAQIVRTDGILAMGKELDEIKNPFIKRGMTLLVSGVKSSEIQTVLTDDISAMEKRHAGFAGVFSEAGFYAPKLGILGAVLGLIAAMASLNDQAALTESIAAALVAVIYGLFTGYVLWHPFGNKLKRKSREEVLHNQVVVAGVLALANGDPPYLVQDKLLSYLSQSEKEKFMVKENEAEKQTLPPI